MGRRPYFLKRLFFAATTIFVAATMNFFLFRIAPGDPVSRFARIPGITAENLEALRRRYGLDGSLFDQYIAYLKSLAKGDLGRSFSDSRPVGGTLLEAYGNTAPMALTGAAIAAVLGITVGVLSAWRRNTALDHSSVGISLVLYSLPAQWLGMMLALLFAGVLPTSGMENEFVVDPSAWQHFVDVLKHMILPSMTLALVLFGQYALIMRSSMLETLGDDYILTARAKGFSNLQTMRTHALRNALLPVATLIALSLSFVVSGVILVEVVFSWPGAGRVMYQAVLERDWPMLQASFLIFTVVVVVLNLLADTLYVKLDPRVAE